MLCGPSGGDESGTGDIFLCQASDFAVGAFEAHRRCFGSCRKDVPRDGSLSMLDERKLFVQHGRGTVTCNVIHMRAVGIYVTVSELSYGTA